MSSKAEVYNLALGMLLLQRRVVDPDTDASNECKVLNTHFKSAFQSVLQELDLDATADEAPLELIEENPNDTWLYVYKYPSKCAFFRRIKSHVTRDSAATQIKKSIKMRDGIKVIYTNEEDAIGEFISTDIPIEYMSENAALCVAAKLAMLSATLQVGKGAAQLRKDLRDMYILYRAAAQDGDGRENFNFSDTDVESEFVTERLS